MVLQESDHQPTRGLTNDPKGNGEPSHLMRYPVLCLYATLNIAFRPADQKGKLLDIPVLLVMLPHNRTL